MIDDAELRRIAGRQGADPMLVDLDYALGCFLASLFRRAEAVALCFKGGTCLRKGYYADYASPHSGYGL
jgi:predicted nucleotidyltransferase component of viral defense system